MKIPYNRVHCRGDVLFATRGGNIHTFSLRDGKHISTWQHPDIEKTAPAGKMTPGAKNKMASDVEVNDPTEVNESEPPAKRQKTKDDVNDDADQEEAQNGDAKDTGEEIKKGKKDKSESKKLRVARVPDLPIIIQLTSSDDGRHVLAVSGHDKVIWVFSHDGQGVLTQLSQR